MYLCCVNKRTRNRKGNENEVVVQIDQIEADVEDV